MVGGVGMEVLEAAGADPYAGFRPLSMSFRHVALNSEALIVRGPWGLPMLAALFPILRAELVVYPIVHDYGHSLPVMSHLSQRDGLTEVSREAEAADGTVVCTCRRTSKRRSLTLSRTAAIIGGVAGIPVPTTPATPWSNQDGATTRL